MTIAAKYADIWESSYLSPKEFLKLNNEFIHITDKSSDMKIERSIKLDVVIAQSITDLEYKQNYLQWKEDQMYYIKYNNTD